MRTSKEDDGRGRLALLLEDDRLAEALAEALPNREDQEKPGTDWGMLFHAWAADLRADRFVVPVTGVQGCGKSLLLNSLLFRDIVLPVEADETTCVPCEIAFGEGNEAQVELFSGDSVSVEQTEEELRAWIDNAQNPGNQKGVRRIVLQSPAEILKEGLVLVDLPGVGSMTSANQQTTEEYLQKAVGLLYLLRSVPPITRSESIFLRFAWNTIPTVLFAQNRWSDESDCEVEAGQEHNEMVLQSVAHDARIPVGESIPIRVLNVHGSMDQIASSDDPADLNGLGVDLAAVSDGWRERVLADRRGRAINVVRDGIEAVNARLGSMEVDQETARSQINAEDRRFRSYFADLDDRFSTASDRIDEYKRNSGRAVRTWAEETPPRLRSEIRQIMIGGVDGANLDSALHDREREAGNSIVEELQVLSCDLDDELRELYSTTGRWQFSVEAGQKAIGIPHKRKIEVLLEPVGGVAGSLAGSAAGFWAGVKIGTAVGFSGGPAGAVVGCVAGGFLGAWIGIESKKGIVRLRADQAAESIKKSVGQFVEETRKVLDRQTADSANRQAEQLRQWMDAQRVRYETQRDIRLSDLANSLDDRTAAVTLLRDAQSTLVESLRKIGEGDD